MTLSQPSFLKSRESHFHVAGLTCPVCDQPVPNEKAEEVRIRLEARDKKLSDDALAGARTEFLAEKTQLEAASRRALEEARKEGADALAKERAENLAAVADAREQARRESDEAAAAKIATVEDRLRESETAWKVRTDEANRGRDAAVARLEDFKQEQERIVASRVEELRATLEKDHADRQAQKDFAHASERQELAAKLVSQEDQSRERETALHGKIDEAVRGRDVAVAGLEDLKQEQERIIASRVEESRAAFEKDRAEWQAHKDAEHASEKQALVAQVASLEDQSRERETGFQEKIDEATRSRDAAVAQYETLKGDQERVVALSVQEAREALEKDHVQKQNKKDADHAAETQKLTSRVTDLARQLEKKTAEELGEGAEVQLFDDLKSEFEPDGDRIERVGRGNPGADIHHTVVYNGQECGVIVYDSKNHLQWRDEFVTKLVSDRTAAKADHAILCARKFPRDEKQLAERDGVLIVNPARAVTLASILRRHMVQIHTLRLSKADRARKMAVLYDFITSEHCANVLSRIESHAEALLEIQVKEMKAHEKVWKDQGTHLRSIVKVLRNDLLREIETIVGTDEVRISEPAV